jgi:hypothetical protein
MATIRGIQPLSFGATVTTGFVTESTTDDDSTDEILIEDEVGNIVTQITDVGVKGDITLEVMPKQGTSPPLVGDVLTYGSQKVVIISISKKRVKKDAQKWTIKGTRYPLITL